MLKKTVSISLIALLTFFTFSCSMKEFIQPIDIQPTKEKGLSVLSFVNLNHKLVVFAPGKPGHIVNGKIVGTAKIGDGDWKVVAIPVSHTRKIHINRFSSGKTIGLAAIILATLFRIQLREYAKGPH